MSFQHHWELNKVEIDDKLNEVEIDGKLPVPKGENNQQDMKKKCPF